MGPTGTRPLDRPARSDWLYRLSVNALTLDTVPRHETSVVVTFVFNPLHRDVPKHTALELRVIAFTVSDTKHSHKYPRSTCMIKTDFHLEDRQYHSFIHSFRSLSYDKATASSKAISPHSAI